MPTKLAMACSNISTTNRSWNSPSWPLWPTSPIVSITDCNSSQRNSLSILCGIHPVAEALRARHALDRLVIAQGAGGPRLQEIIDLARQARIPVRFEPRASLDRLAGSAAHQGVVALGAAKKYADLEAAAAAEMVVVLDG